MTGRVRGQQLYSLEAIYRADSAFVHPTITAVRHYVVETADNIELRVQPIDRSGEAAATCNVIAVGSFNAAAFVNELLPNNPWGPRLHELATRYGFPTRDPS